MPTILPSAAAAGVHPTTGRTVLLWLLAFFGIVFAANGALVHFALSTLGGVETQSSYKAGLAFADESRQADEQQQRHWHVEGSVHRTPDGKITIRLEPLDAADRPLTGLAITAMLHHPVDARLDRAVAVTEGRPGSYSGSSDASAGQWEVLIDMSRGAERLFRSRNRIELQ